MDQRIRTLVWVVMAGGLLLASEQVCPQRWAAVGQQPATNTVHGPGTVPQPMLIPPEEGMRPSGAPDVPAAQAPRPAESLPGDARPAASAGMKVPVPPAPSGATLSADAPKSSPDAPAIPDVRPVQEASPPLFYLKDESGNLVPVPGFRLEDFESMVKRQHRSGTADQAPRYTIQSVAATGTAKNSYAELSIQLKILIQEEGWVRVPLRLDQAVLRGGQEYRGPGQQFLHYEPAAEGYVLWVRSGPGQEHQLTLDALVPLVRLGEETRLRLIVPRAATSELRLSVPMVGVVAEASEGATLLPPVATAESSTLLTAVGIGGDLELAWRKEGTPPAESPSVLEAVGQLQVKADGRGFEADVQLSVRSLGGPFDSFRVRLPKGAELVPAKTSQYTLNAVKAAGPTEQARLVEVRLAKKTIGPVEVRLATRMPLDVAGPALWIDVAACEVLGAVRQTGHVAVRADSQWRVLVGTLRNARQVDDLPRTLRSDDLAAGFEYFSQPCSLPIRVVRRSPRVSVEPEYVLLVDADQVSLEARLKYVVRAAEVGSLEIDFPGWQFDEAGPENLVAGDRVFEESGVLSLPLVQRSIGPLEIVLRGHRRLPPGAKSIALELPRPRADSQASAAVVVLPADNVELVPDSSAALGLVRQQVALQMKLPQRQQDPLFYRAEPAKAVFAAALRVHPQKVSASAASQITAEEQRVEVEQRLSYTVAYKPTDRLSIDVPRALAGPDQIALSFEGKPAATVDLPDPNDQPDPAGPARKQVVLPGARIGPCELVIRYGVELPRLVPRSSVTATIPLVMPAQAELAGNTAVLLAKEGVRVRQREGPWAEAGLSDAAAPRPALRRGLQLAASQPAPEIAIEVQLEDQTAAGSTVVERAWIQTWLTRTTRQDRAVFQVTTSQRNLSLVVPAGVSLAEVELWLDGQRCSASSTPEARLIVPLPEGDPLRQHRLEAIYRFALTRPSPGRMSLELPHLGRRAWVQRLYWQLALPPDEHVVADPADLTSEFRWGFNGLFWGRNPTLEQPSLETWAGGRRLAELPLGTSRYLFSSAGTVTRCELRTAGRATVVLASSAVVLVLGLMLIHLPRARHPASLFSLAVLLGAGAVAYPGPTLLAGQAAALGVVLALGAAWLRAGVSGKRRLGAREAPSSILERGSARATRRAAAVSGEAPTEIMPDAAAVRTMDSRA